LVLLLLAGVSMLSNLCLLGDDRDAAYHDMTDGTIAIASFGLVRGEWAP
jgi:hypothetical protein